MGKYKVIGLDGTVVWSGESWDRFKVFAANQQKILENIKKEALSKKLAWDDYDACQQYVHVRSRANWKLTEELDQAFRKEIEDFPVPVAAFYMKMGDNPKELLEFVRKNKAGLQASRNEEFYEIL